MLALWFVTQSWHRYDADGSGEIELEEFREMMEVMLPAMGAEYRIYQQHHPVRLQQYATLTPPRLCHGMNGVHRLPTLQVITNVLNIMQLVEDLLTTLL